MLVMIVKPGNHGWQRDMGGQVIEVDSKPFGGCFVYHPKEEMTKGIRHQSVVKMIAISSVVEVLSVKAWVSIQAWSFEEEHDSFLQGRTQARYQKYLEDTYQKFKA